MSERGVIAGGDTPPTVTASFGMVSSAYAGHALNADEFAVCEQRGHQSSGHGITSGIGPTWTYCRWCGVRFRFTEPACVVHDDDLDAIEGMSGG